MKDWTKDHLPSFFQGDDKVHMLYLYTPLCGTCQVAGKMVEIVAELLPQFEWGKCDLNYFPHYAENWQIESVPCLAIFQGSKLLKKIYAFQSVTYLYETLKKYG